MGYVLISVGRSVGRPRLDCTCRYRAVNPLSSQPLAPSLPANCCLPRNDTGIAAAASRRGLEKTVHPSDRPTVRKKVARDNFSASIVKAERSAHFAGCHLAAD